MILVRHAARPSERRGFLPDTFYGFTPMFRSVALAMLLLSGSLAAADLELGRLSEKYESGGRGPGMVSTGVGDPGGVLYGTYQLASKIGRADAFAAKYYPADFKGLKGGTEEFTAKWKALAAADPKALHANEHEYIRTTHYDPQCAKLLEDVKLDVGKRSATLRDVIWSTAVHHGPATDVVTVALKPLLAAGKIADVKDEAVIQAVYAERGRTTAAGKLARFPKVDDSWIPGLTKRFVSEQKDALAQLKKESK